MNADAVLKGMIEGLSGAILEGRITFDDEGRAAFSVSDDLIVSIDHLPETNQILLFAELGQLDDGPEVAPLIRELLNDSLEFAASFGGALGVDQETQAVALFARKSAAGLSNEAFEDWLGDVADFGDVWCRRLREPRHVSNGT